MDKTVSTRAGENGNESSHLTILLIQSLFQQPSIDRIGTLGGQNHFAYLFLEVLDDFLHNSFSMKMAMNDVLHLVLS